MSQELKKKYCLKSVKKDILLIMEGASSVQKDLHGMERIVLPVR